MNDKLTSLECSDIINWIAFKKHSVALNKTQMQKILYLCYGIYYAQSNTTLFDDDSPRAWPFGPVFPRVNKNFEPGFIKDIQPSVINKLKADNRAFNTIVDAVKRYHKYSATYLSAWSHKEDGPWYGTVYGDGTAEWNKEISKADIKDYFEKLINERKYEI